jgi:signal transduction histidine kinase
VRPLRIEKLVIAGCNEGTYPCSLMTTLPKSPIPGPNPPADDLTTLKAENAALRAELKEARKTNQQYLQNVAHQLTAPLGAIKWSIEALKDSGVPIQVVSRILWKS